MFGPRLINSTIPPSLINHFQRGLAVLSVPGIDEKKRKCKKPKVTELSCTKDEYYQMSSVLNIFAALSCNISFYFYLCTVAS